MRCCAWFAFRFAWAVGASALCALYAGGCSAGASSEGGATKALRLDEDAAFGLFHEVLLGEYFAHANKVLIPRKRDRPAMNLDFAMVPLNQVGASAEGRRCDASSCVQSQKFKIPPYAPDSNGRECWRQLPDALLSQIVFGEHVLDRRVATRERNKYQALISRWVDRLIAGTLDPEKTPFYDTYRPGKEDSQKAFEALWADGDDAGDSSAAGQSTASGQGAPVCKLGHAANYQRKERETATFYFVYGSRERDLEGLYFVVGGVVTQGKSLTEPHNDTAFDMLQVGVSADFMRTVYQIKGNIIGSSPYIPRLGIADRVACVLPEDGVTPLTLELTNNP